MNKYRRVFWKSVNLSDAIWKCHLKWTHVKQLFFKFIDRDMLFHDVIFAAVCFAFYSSGNTFTFIFSLVFLLLLYFIISAKSLKFTKYTWVKMHSPIFLKIVFDDILWCLNFAILIGYVLFCVFVIWAIFMSVSICYLCFMLSTMILFEFTKGISLKSFCWKFIF